MSTDMSVAVVPKSDQLNAEDLIPGPITVTIERVVIRPGEQPVTVHIVGRKPYKPCKTMCRILILAWGSDADLYKGRRLTLYRDPDVRWAGKAVGGIRISYMSDIREPITTMLSETKGKYAEWTVRPLVDPKPAQKPAQNLRTAIGDALKSDRGWNEERVSGLLAMYGAKKAADVAADRVGAVMAALSVPYEAPREDAPGNRDDDPNPLVDEILEAEANFGESIVESVRAGMGISMTVPAKDIPAKFGEEPARIYLQKLSNAADDLVKGSR